MVNKKSKKERVKEQQKEEKKANRVAAMEYFESNPNVSIRETAKEFHIPYSTLHDLVSGESSIDSQVGRKPYFNPSEEDELKQWIFNQVDNNFEVDEKEVLDKANKMYQCKYQSNKNLTDGWFQDFRKRNPDVVRRVAEHLEQIRKNHQDILYVETFFDDLDSLIKQHNMLPEQIYNCDETGIQQNEANHYTLAKKGSHPSIVVPTQRSTCTILTC